jgi:hypothetical protein
VAELVVTVAPENKGAKDDLRDVWARANELRMGSIKTRAYKASLHRALLGNAVRGYGFAVRDTVRAMCRLRSPRSGWSRRRRRTPWTRRETPFAGYALQTGNRQGHVRASLDEGLTDQRRAYEAAKAM